MRPEKARDHTRGKGSVTRCKLHVCAPLDLDPPSPPAKSTHSGSPAWQPERQCYDCLVALAHRLSQPVTALRGSIELALLAEGMPTERRATLEQWLGLADQLVNSITFLRELAESLILSGPSEDVSLAELVVSTAEELGDLTRCRNVEATIKANTSLTVHTNRGMLRQIVLRLLRRAVIDCPPGGTVSLTVSEHDKCACLVFEHPCLSTFPSEPESAPGGFTPGWLFSEATRGGGLDWTIAKTLLKGIGGRLEMQNIPGEEGRFLVRTFARINI